MTEQDKELLLRDLCARLPHGVKVSILGGGAMELKSCINSSIGWYADINGAPTDFGIDEIKPYLRPLSSMTEEELREYDTICTKLLNQYKACPKNSLWVMTYTDSEMIDFFNAHHFDYRGLIEKGLAIAVTEENNPYR